MYKKCRGQIPVERREPAKKYLLHLLYITTKLYTVLLAVLRVENTDKAQVN